MNWRKDKKYIIHGFPQTNKNWVYKKYNDCRREGAMTLENDKITRELVVQMFSVDVGWEDYSGIDPPIFQHAVNEIGRTKQIDLYKNIKFRIIEINTIYYKFP